MVESYLAIAGKVHFMGNKAALGGAIFVYDTTDLVYCSLDIPGAQCIIEDCFFQKLSFHNDSLMVFDGNIAVVVAS